MAKNEKITWKTGDMFCVPVTKGEMVHICTSSESHGAAALYWVHDEPLMNYLGATPNVKKFEPTLYKKEVLLEKVQQIQHETGDCHLKNRLGVLLGNAKCAQTKTLTHVLWSLLNSVPGGVFITPPGWWHSHHNESDEQAWVLPVQDAGLFTHQRTLDIRFVDDELELHKAGRIRGSAFAITNKDYTEMVEIGAKVPTSAGDGLKNKSIGLKRVLSAECFLTSKRLKCTQVGSGE